MKNVFLISPRLAGWAAEPARRPSLRGVTRKLTANLAIAMSLLAAGCSAPRVDIRTPTTAMPAAPVAVPMAARSGAIFAEQSSGAFRPLFEDRRPRAVGDTLIVRIEERINAAQKNSTSAQKTASASLGIPVISHLPGKGFAGLSGNGTSSNQFDGEGESNASNTLTGNVAVTVVEVLANGNLVVSGEKQLGTNQELQMLRFSGIVNPANIQAGNSVSSTQVADARVEYRGQGAVDAAQTAGWVSKFLWMFSPF